MDCGLNGLLIGAIAPFDGYRQLLLSLFLVWKKMDVSSEVVWVDGEGASQCNVPMLYFSFARIPAFIGLGLACFLAFVACGTVGVLYLILPEETPVMPILLVVGGAFSVLFLPIIAFIVWKSLLILYGSKQIVIDGRSLRVITRFGPIWSTVKCQLSKLGGFRIEDPQGQRYQINLEYSNLWAVQHGGRAVPLLRMFANEIVGQLVEELPHKIEQVTGESHNLGSQAIQADDLTAELSAADPFRIQDRNAKPIGSEISVEAEGQGLLIKIPARGFRKSTSRTSAFVCLGFLFCELFVLAVLVPALLAGRVEGQPAAGWFMVGIFTVVVIGMLLYRVNAAIQSGTIRIRRDLLSFREYGLFGKQYEEWEREAIQSVRVEVEEYRTSESISFDHFISVKPASDSERQWFSHLGKDELEWMAASIQKHLDLDAGEE